MTARNKPRQGGQFRRVQLRALVDHLASRTSALGLTVQIDKTREYVARLSTLVTALAMNFLYTDKFFDE